MNSFMCKYKKIILNGNVIRWYQFIIVYVNMDLIEKIYIMIKIIFIEYLKNINVILCTLNWKLWVNWDE